MLKQKRHVPRNNYIQLLMPSLTSRIREEQAPGLLLPWLWNRKDLMAQRTSLRLVWWSLKPFGLFVSAVSEEGSPRSFREPACWESWGKSRVLLGNSFRDLLPPRKGAIFWLSNPQYSQMVENQSGWEQRTKEGHKSGAELIPFSITSIKVSGEGAGLTCSPPTIVFCFELMSLKPFGGGGYGGSMCYYFKTKLKCTWGVMDNILILGPSVIFKAISNEVLDHARAVMQLNPSQPEWGGSTCGPGAWMQSQKTP